MGGILGILSQESSFAERKIGRSIHAESKNAAIFNCLVFNDKKNVGLGNWSSIESASKKEWTEGDWRIVFEGNLYNDNEIKCDLESEGVTIQKGTPAELVLKSFILWKQECLLKFNGEFAVAIWNEKEAKLFLFRDKIGVKPLYYHLNGTTFHFSSELKGITPFIQQEVWDETAIQYYFRLGYIPSPYTIYKEVFKLTEGSILTVELDFLALPNYELIPEKYWKIEEKVSKNVLSDEKEAKNELNQLISKSVELRTRKQASFGTFLSGGIDSSLVTSVAQAQSDKPISTFSIGFEESSHNESGFAKEIAKKLGTSHNELILSLKTAQDLITKIPEWYEQPYADASAIPSFLAAQMASKEVGMILTGDGGDEQFMGYGMYTWADRLKTVRNSRAFIKLLLQLSPKINHKRVSQYFDLKENEPTQSHIFSVDQGFFSANSLRKHFHFTAPDIAMLVEKTERRLLVSEQQALFDMKYYLPGDLTVKIDRVTEQVNLDARAPLLDPSIVEWSLNLDEKLKRKGGLDKYLLKQVLFDYLPAELFDRPKWGFGIPLGKWLSSELRPLLEEYVNETELKKHPFYNVKAILELKKQFLVGKSYLSTQLWLIIIFNMWVRNTEK